MKIVTAQAMADLEAAAYQQGHTEQAFMEQAGHGISLAIQDFIKRHPSFTSIILLCGKGNNGGDAFVAGCYLLDQGYQVSAVQLEPLANCSPLCQQNGTRFLQRNGKISKELKTDASCLLIDGLFGTGFKGEVREPYASLIEAANRSGCPLLAIDVPSGLNGSTGEMKGPVIQATETFFLGLPKLGFFLREGWSVVGKLKFVDFGLPPSFIEQVPAHLNLLTQPAISKLLPPIKRTRHKYQAGHVVGLAGSPSMPGAALLASLAAFRTGSGMVHLLHPKGMEAELAASPYELIKVPYDNSATVLTWLQKGGAFFVGPGIGRSAATAQLLQECLPQVAKPCVMDADALSLFAQQAFKLPAQVILTPHRGEMQTLLHSSLPLVLDESLLKTCQDYAASEQVILVLKGAPTFIFDGKGSIFVSPTGDPGMATAGSGDVLTGMLASLLAQALSCLDAACFGVYVHGLCGELAANLRGTSRGVMAEDLIDQLAAAYHLIQ